MHLASHLLFLKLVSIESMIKDSKLKCKGKYQNLVFSKNGFFPM